MYLVNTWARSCAEAVERDLLVAFPVIDIRYSCLQPLQAENANISLIRLKKVIISCKIGEVGYIDMFFYSEFYSFFGCA